MALSSTDSIFSVHENISLFDYIIENYDIKYQNTSDIKEVKFFLLCDIHNRPGVKKINSTFIDRFCSNNDYIMVEAQPSLQEVSAQESYQSSWLKSSSKIVGWDLDKIENIVGEQLSKYVRTDLLIAHDIPIEKLLNPNCKEDKKLLKEAAIEIGAKILALSMDVPDNFKDKIAETFSKRVVSMIQSLNGISAKADRVFLTAGAVHLIELPIFSEDSRFSIEKFQDWLQGNKAMILMPKVKKINKIEEPIEYLEMEYALKLYSGK